MGSGAGEYKLEGVFKNTYNAGTKKKDVEMNIVSFAIFVGNGKIDEGVLEIPLSGIDIETKAYLYYCLLRRLVVDKRKKTGTVGACLFL